MSLSIGDCGICISPYGTNKSPASLQCGHSFCTECLERILADKGSDAICPHCRSPFRRDQMRTLYVSPPSNPMEGTGKSLFNWRRFQICVRDLQNKSHMVKVNKSDSVLNLKTAVREKTGIPEIYQRLIYRNKQLQDGETLESYHIERDSTIHLTSRMKGGTGSNSSP